MVNLVVMENIMETTDHQIVIIAVIAIIHQKNHRW